MEVHRFLLGSMPWQRPLNDSLKQCLIESVCHAHGTVIALSLLSYVSALFVFQLCQVDKDIVDILEKLAGSGKH